MPSPPATLRVASVPAAHPYVAHLTALETDGVVRLPDPAPPGAPPGRWWPPVMVDPGWIAAHAAEIDVMHLHFGLESFAPAHLEAVVGALRSARRPLVFTVHDLVNPQLTDQAPHRAQLDVVVPAADALVTLTPGAAAEVDRRWGRRAEVIAHPHVLGLDAPLPAGAERAARTVGLHLRDLRPNVDGPGATTAAVDAVGRLRAGGADVELAVFVHDRVRDKAARDAVRRACRAAEFATLVEQPRPDDAALAAELAGTDAAVLPYAHGTHSGWLELCWDLGVGVAAPDVGFAAEQHAGDGVLGFARGDGASLATTLRALLGLGGAPAAPRPGTAARRALVERRREARRAERAGIARAHLALYRRLVAG